jgi:hypothetical protein
MAFFFKRQEPSSKARAQSHHDKGYQTVVIEIPPQNAENGVVKLKAIEGKVRR